MNYCTNSKLKNAKSENKTLINMYRTVSNVKQVKNIGELTKQGNQNILVNTQ
jgi:hypothetical protein